MATCRSCGANIVWAESKNGKAMPVDAMPVENGNIALMGVDGQFSAEVLTKDELAEAREHDMPLHLSHHVTCPQGAAWRKRR